VLASPHPTLRFADAHFRRCNNLCGLYKPGKLRLTYNARAAFYQLISSLRASERRTILLPAFHCTALVEPVARTAFKTSFYRITQEFRPDLEDVRRRLSQDVAAIVIVHYFGFPAELEPFLKLKEEFGCIIVEDCAHSFLSQAGGSGVGHAGDFSLFSFYKFAPSLAGGGLGINVEKHPELPEQRRVPWREQLTLAKRLFEQMLENSPENPTSKLLLKAERWRVNRRQSVPPTSRAALVDDPYLFRNDLANSGMPALCRHVLESNDWNENVASRRRNYALFAEELQDGPSLKRVFPHLPQGVCPWAFPVLLANRRQHEQQLRALGVPLYSFGEILHPLLAEQNDQARKDAEHISEQLILLPVHVQLDSSKVREIARRIRTYVDDLAARNREAMLRKSVEK
jgi:perosamine synthetase